ncbi:MAG: hypothetical protein E5X48_22950 [Mesorhizobium sp.]|uniref:hypothetical protein n=1 Tax=Mesorhizobium sp. TaxID=1871066 RepID=UPI00122A287D|nr:hypothetical protein [Mesorhizobium sp.]TIQ33520.1 MAG: hypothetical protein E5X48_22950 [Mesorhizobium sp.]
MPIGRYAENGGFFEPDELAHLQNIFDQICARGEIDRRSEQAEFVATYLITLYRRGLRGDELFDAVSPKMPRRLGHPHGTAPVRSSESA